VVSAEDNRYVKECQTKLGHYNKPCRSFLSSIDRATSHRLHADSTGRRYVSLLARKHGSSGRFTRTRLDTLYPHRVIVRD
jgi:hypothetical protein